MDDWRYAAGAGTVGLQRAPIAGLMPAGESLPIGPRPNCGGRPAPEARHGFGRRSLAWIHA
jgi:hypothetical protein